MSTIPRIRQVRRPINMADGSVQLEVTTTVFDQGDLPFPDLFVLSIVNTADPRRDVLARIATPYDIRQTSPTSPRFIKVTANDMVVISGDPFARIANINDITALARDRTDAVRTGRTVYLSSVCTLIYDNITTADAAYRQIISRLSSLVTEWRTAFTAFATNPSQVYNLPQADNSVVAAREAAYVAARTSRRNAETARDAAVTASNNCQQTGQSLRMIYEFLVADVSFLQTARTVVQGITEAGATTNAKDFVLHTGAYASDNRSYDVLLTSKITSRDAYAQQVTAHQTECQALANAALAAQNAVEAALTVERAALAAVYAVCPNFDPTTV